MNMRCSICNSTDQWENIDHLRLKKSGMHICKGCGFVSYPSEYKTEEQIKEYYRKEYRPGPQAGNLFTGERKLQYHELGLKPVFDKWVTAGFENPTVGEIGAAYGLMLHWLKNNFPKANVIGTELTETYRRVAYHEFGLKLQEDLDYNKKYDLLISYHVLEHQLDPDKMLEKYASVLKSDGYFYLGTPVWFKEASNSAQGGFDIEYYWAKDHINSWSEEHLEYLFYKAGLKIVWKDTAIYGNTYLLQKAEAEPLKPHPSQYKENLEKAEKIWSCWNLIQENQTEMAIATYRNCPAAWINNYELNRAKLHQDKEAFNRYIAEMVEACPNSADTTMFAGDILTRYERYEESRELLMRAVKIKVNNPTILMGIANTFRMQGRKETDPKKKAEYILKSIEILRFTMSISTEMLPQCLSWIYQDESLLPVPETK